ncbi:TlpA family protein disulfide reductase [Tenacibaculum salmonis]|uniref:TlpA family protein disulfide reductase n=1 Tax=Tenacibaculum sp. P3-BQ1 TaxID=3232310 RepID=UPI0034DF9C6A
MKNILPILLSIIIGSALSLFILNTFLNTTTENNKTTKDIKKSIKNEVTTDAKKVINLNNMQDSFDNWKTYMKENVDLMATFNPIDSEGNLIEKGMFLTLLRTGAYVVIKSKKDKNIEYKLTTIKEPVNEKIKKAITRKAHMANQYYKMEGKKLPKYDFIDLEGKSHNKAVSKGNITVLKSWFINCKVCVEEFPKLNDLVDIYKDKDIQFISLAFNEKDKLKKFLKKKPFKYVTIPDQKRYMSKELKVKQYPTHIIINSDGVILKMVNNVNTLTSELERIFEE